jgi:hypothetical protein
MSKKLDEYNKATAALHGVAMALDKLELAVRQLQKKTPLGELMADIRRLEKQALRAMSEIRAEAERLEPPPLKADLRPVPRRQVN